VLSNRQPIFVPNAKIGDWTVNQQRVQAAIDYGIQSICFLPVLGGVLEVGNSDACVASGNTWEGVEAVTEDGLPKAELERAFRSGATYAIYWKPDYAKGEYGLRACYETSAQALSADACETKTYVNECRSFRPSIESDGPIGEPGLPLNPNPNSHPCPPTPNQARPARRVSRSRCWTRPRTRASSGAPSR